MNPFSPFFVLAVLFAGTAGFFLACNPAAPEPTTTRASIANSDPSVVDSIVAPVAEDSTRTTDTTGTTSNAESTTLPTTTASAILPRIPHGISDHKLSFELETIAQNLEKKKLAYVTSLGQDCSGIFHQIKDSLQARIPALRQSAQYQYPSFTNDRSSRQIADWYYRNNNLLIVEDAMASRNSIRPGSVLFFSKPGKTFKNITIEMLTDRDNNYTSNGAIMHIAVVTSVQMDENGDVIAYTMMHGRNKKYPASRSGSKVVQSDFTPGLPPFGNWSQQWVAVANIMTPVN